MRFKLVENVDILEGENNAPRREKLIKALSDRLIDQQQDHYICHHLKRDLGRSDINNLSLILRNPSDSDMSGTSIHNLIHLLSKLFKNYGNNALNIPIVYTINGKKSILELALLFESSDTTYDQWSNEPLNGLDNEE